MITQYEFNWSITDRPLVIFIPNFGRGDYIRKTLDQFKTSANKNDYCIVIGNDRLHDDFSDLIDQNIYYFTLGPMSNPENRNGGFIRNYFIKRCRSNIIMQKDPETEFWAKSDFIHNLIEIKDVENFIYRPGYTGNLPLNVAIKDSPIPLHPVYIGHYQRIHWGFATNTKVLQNIRGYDEDYTKYGPEDRDIYQRLTNNGITEIIDPNVSIIHYDHPIDVATFKDCGQMELVYRAKDHRKIVRNPYIWGEGNL